jgi:methyl-accepting chemotaxis protein
MSLKVKALILVIIIVLFLTTTVVVTSRLILSKGFGELENRDTMQNTERAIDALSNRLAALESKMKDWAYWDDSYKFIEDGNQDYIDSNLSEGALTNMGLNLMAFVDTKGKVVFGASNDLAAGKSGPLPAGFEALLQGDSLLLKHTDEPQAISGIVNLPQGPMLITSLPILTSNSEGPWRGAIIVGRFLDEKFITELSNTTHLSIKLAQYNDAQLPVDMAAILPGLSSQTPKIVQVVDNQTVAGYGLLNDIYGNPALIISISLERAIVRQGESSEFYFIIAVIIASLICGLMIMLLLQKFVLKRITRLTQAAERVSQGDVNVEIPDTMSKDELGDLARSFQQTITYVSRAAQGAECIARGDLTIEMGKLSEGDILGEAFAAMTQELRKLVSRISRSAGHISDAGSMLTETAHEADGATEQVTSIIQRVAKGAAEQNLAINSAATQVEQLAHASNGIAQGAQEQANAITRTSILISEMARLVEQIENMAESVISTVEEVMSAARKGALATEKTREGMQSIQKHSDGASEKVKEMGERAGEVGRIVVTIDEIADKTDMLALNAAVEAARAGEYGRGFAVVADQVRKLSEDSKQATKEIASLVERVQHSVREATEAMKGSSAEIITGMQLASQAAELLGQIERQAQDAAGMAGQVGEAMSQVKQKTDAVVSAVESVSAVVEENSASAAEMADSSNAANSAIDGVAGISEENSAAAEEMQQSIEKLSCRVKEVTNSAVELADLAEELRACISIFKLSEADLNYSYAEEQAQPEVSPALAARPRMIVEGVR